MATHSDTRAMRGNQEQPMTKENRALEIRLYWGEILLGINSYFKPKRITIGETKRSDVFTSCEGLPVEEYPLVRTRAGEHLLTFFEQMEGEVEIDGQLSPLASLRASSRVRQDPELPKSQQIVLPVNARAIIHWQSMTLAMRFVAPLRPVRSKPWQNLDLRYINALVLSTVLHTLLFTTLMIHPYDAGVLLDDLFEHKHPFAELPVRPHEKESPAESLLRKSKEKTKRSPKNEQQDLEKSVEVGRKESNKSERRRQTRAKHLFAKMLQTLGVGRTILGDSGGGTLAGELQNLIGTQGSSSRRLAGFEIRGVVQRGGYLGQGRSITSIGAPDRVGYDDSDDGRRFGSDRRFDNRWRFGSNRRGDRDVVDLSPPEVIGALPKAVIRKVVNNNKKQIRYCYEIELQRDQTLAGKLTVKWLIGSTGLVAKVIVLDSTLNNSNVEKCITSRIEAWIFPQPAGGGIVEVNYPFVLRAI
jgi:hypothetical protein